MSHLSCFFLLLAALPTLNAQDFADLSYPQLDSLLSIYEEHPGQYAEEGLALCLHASQRTGGQDSVYGEYMEWATLFYETLGDYEQTVDAYHKALNAFARSNGVESARYATTLGFFGLFKKEMGRYDEARALLTQAAAIQKQSLGPQHPEFAYALNNLAGFYQETGNYEQALSLYLQVLNNMKAALPADHPALANSLNDLALLHQKMGNYDRALPLLIQSKDIVETNSGNTGQRFASSLNNLAFLYKKMGKYEQALPLFLQAKDIREQALGQFNPQFANSLNNLADVYQKLGQHDKALSLLIQAKNITEEVLGDWHPFFATSLSNLANLHQEMKQYNQALPLHRQALHIRTTVFGATHPDVARSLNDLASLYLAVGAYAPAWERALQAIASSSKISLSANITAPWADTLLQASFASNRHLEETIAVLNTLYLLLQNDPKIQQPATQQLIITDLVTTLLAQLRSSISNDNDKLRILAQSNQWLQRSLNGLYNLGEASKAFALADQNKSVLLLQASRSEAAYQLGNLPDSLVWLDKQLNQEQSQLQAQLLQNRTEEDKAQLRNTLNEVNQAIDDWVLHIKTAYPKYHQLRYQQPHVQVTDVQQYLDDRTALLEYVLSDSAIHLFYIDRHTVIWKKNSIPPKLLNQRIKRFHNALSQLNALNNNPPLAYQRYTREAYWFYQQLLAPILKDQPHIDHLILVTDGKLGHLPFETFLTEPAPKEGASYQDLAYLLHHYTISYNYSAALWKENMEAPSPQNNGQIMGVAANYELQLDSSMLEVRLPPDQWLRAKLGALPGARAEVELLQQHYQGFFAFDTLASECTVKQRASAFAVLHFATHGILDAQRPLLSSLALSENNDPTESNFWRAHEISQMPLNANLVVLSACETGYGKFEQGNGIASLARSFMYAGAPSLVVSLWQVNDYATSRIMEHFYHHLAEGLPIDQALRQAKLNYLQTATGKAAHPLFWSPFIHLGKTQSVALQPNRSGWLNWELLIFASALLFFGAWGVHRKAKNMG